MGRPSEMHVADADAGPGSIRSTCPFTVQVDLDRNLIMTRGEPLVIPQLGEKLRRKLMRALQVCVLSPCMVPRTTIRNGHVPLQVNGDVFAHRGTDWLTARLPNYDSAFNFAARPSEAADDPFALTGAGSAIADEAHDPGAALSWPFIAFELRLLACFVQALTRTSEGRLAPLAVTPELAAAEVVCM